MLQHQCSGGIIHLLHMGTLQLARLWMIGAFTSTFTGKLEEHTAAVKHQSQKVGLIPFHSLSEKEFARKENSPNSPSTMHVWFLLLLFQGAVSTLMNSKMLRFAFQFGNLPLKGDKVPQLPPPPLNHIKHTAIFCEAPQQCHHGSSASPSLCLLRFVGPFTS